MQHDWEKYFDTSTDYWRKVQEIYEENDEYPKKVVPNRNLHHKFMRSFSKAENVAIDNDYDNLVSLDFASHFLVHYYLWKCSKKGYRSKCALAFTYMRKKMTKYIDDDTVEMMALDYANLMRDISTVHAIIGRRVLNDPNHPWNNKTKKQLIEASKKAHETIKLRPDYKDVCYRCGAALRGKTYKEAYGEEKAKVLSEKRTKANNLRWEKYYNDLERIKNILGDSDEKIVLSPEETGYARKKVITLSEMVHWLWRYYEKDPEIITRLEKLLNEMKEINNKA